MGRYDRYALSQLTLMFGFFALVLIGVYWVNRAIGIFDMLIGSGHSGRVFARYMVLFLPQVIIITLPVAGLVAAAYVVRRLQGDSEFVVLQTAGAGPWRLARPFLLFGLVLATLSGMLSHVFVPQSRSQLLALEAELAADTLAGLVQPGRFVHPAGGVSFFVRDVSADGELREVFLHDARDPTRPDTYIAARARLIADQGMAKLLMIEGHMQSLVEPGARLRTVHFDEAGLDLTAFIPAAASRRASVRDFSTRDALRPSEELLAATGLRRESFLIEAHDRLVQPVFPLVLPLLAFALLTAGPYRRAGSIRPLLWLGFASVTLVLAHNTLRPLVAQDVGLWPVLYLPGVAGLALTGGLLWYGSRGPRARHAGSRPGSALP